MDIIKSVYSDQTEILQAIIKLYCKDGFELDPTYSIGNFYKRIPQPKFKFDIEPQAEGVVQADCRKLPMENESVSTIMFDPPFIHTQAKVAGLIQERFGGGGKSMYEIWKLYYDSMLEFFRVLKSNGILVFKCQDGIEGGKQYLTHVEIINQAIKIGFYPEDLFILLSSNRMLNQNRVQQHARKFHSYFIVFKKIHNKVRYTAPSEFTPTSELAGISSPSHSSQNPQTPPFPESTHGGSQARKSGA